MGFHPGFYYGYPNRFADERLYFILFYFTRFVSALFKCRVTTHETKT